MSRALVVDDDLSFRLGVAELVQREGFQTRTAGDLAGAREQLASDPPDVVLVDLMLPDGSGLDLLNDLTPEGGTEVIIITGHASVDSVIEALRRGVLDFLTKPVDSARLKSVLANLARTTRLKEEIGSLRKQLRGLGRFGELIGSSPAMQEVFDLIGRVSPTEATVLLTGESGTGKEVAARTIHDLSRRRAGPFLPINCGAVPEGLIESELFGHERGSFTGATQLRRGCFERASGGTLFLDEIGEMPVELQVKLLRVLETAVAVRVGGDQAVPVDVRVIAATNRPPELAVGEGKLREDLLYRLNVFPILLPPLRERRGDVARLADHFLAELNQAEGSAKRFADGAHARLEIHPWHGNVRELRNVIQRAYIMAEEEVDPRLTSAPQVARPMTATATVPATVAAGVPAGVPLEEIERQAILSTLRMNRGDKRRTALALGIALKTLYNRLKRYSLEAPLAGGYSADESAPPAGRAPAPQPASAEGDPADAPLGS